MQHQPACWIYACQSQRGLSYKLRAISYDVSHMYLADTEVFSLTTNPQIQSGLGQICMHFASTTVPGGA